LDKKDNDTIANDVRMRDAKNTAAARKIREADDTGGFFNLLFGDDSEEEKPKEVAEKKEATK